MQEIKENEISSCNIQINFIFFSQVENMMLNILFHVIFTVNKFTLNTFQTPSQFPIQKLGTNLREPCLI